MSDEYFDDTTISEDEITEEEVIEMYKRGDLVPSSSLSSQSTSSSSSLDDYSNSMYGGLSSGFGSDPRLTQSQAHLRYLLGTDEVPDSIKKHKLWSLVSRHLQLIRVESVEDLPYFRREIRDIIRTAMWNRELSNIPYSDLRQIEFFAELLLRKSIDRGERMLLSMQITRMQQEDLGERSPSSSNASNTAPGGSGLAGALKKMFGGFMGR